MDFAKSHLLWYLMRTPGVPRGSRLGRVLVTLATKRVAVVAVPAAVGFAYFISEFLDEKAKGLIDTIKHVRDPRKDSSTGSTLWRTTVMVVPITKHVTNPKEPGQEKDSSTGSKQWFATGVAAGLAAGLAARLFAVVRWHACAVVDLGSGGNTFGSLAAKGTPLAATTGFGTSAIGGLQSVGAAGLTASKPFLVESTETALVRMIINGSGNEDKKEK